MRPAIHDGKLRRRAAGGLSADRLFVYQFFPSRKPLRDTLVAKLISPLSPAQDLESLRVRHGISPRGPSFEGSMWGMLRGSPAGGVRGDTLPLGRSPTPNRNDERAYAVLGARHFAICAGGQAVSPWLARTPPPKSPQERARDAQSLLVCCSSLKAMQVRSTTRQGLTFLELFLRGPVQPRLGTTSPGPPNMGAAIEIEISSRSIHFTAKPPRRQKRIQQTTTTRWLRKQEHLVAEYVNPRWLAHGHFAKGREAHRRPQSRSKSPAIGEEDKSYSVVSVHAPIWASTENPFRPPKYRMCGIRARSQTLAAVKEAKLHFPREGQTPVGAPRFRKKKNLRDRLEV